MAALQIEARANRNLDLLKHAEIREVQKIV